ncbi:hypothetical protein LTR56_010591 [Elasticomyces elasticus]|nr:hypothetical protein LTR56_010591 [Elasticomyces elasticus]KAK3648670.1 hypothetical protein LTR22_013306 [Elasticomyces elasticus]KAK4932447.1 hypothetical protein LTR49_001316 [Elasticomyces elasticus]KAK5760148.1 hypothetical protein LTS12_009703 [Elasticomyces elasticus]
MLLRRYLCLVPVTTAVAAPTLHPSDLAALAQRSAFGTTAYFLDNDPSGNSIVSLVTDRHGMLSSPVRTSTRGRGSDVVSLAGVPAAVDTLGSQGSVVVSGNLLFTVNAGSNTASMFVIDPADASYPRLIGTPVDTLGEFPISVDYSPILNIACVLNGGAKAGVSCFDVNTIHGLRSKGQFIKLDKSIINEQTPPSGPPGSAAQIRFNPDSTALFVTVKGSTTAPVKLGSLVAWPIHNGVVSHTRPVVSQFQNVTLDFGFQFISRSTIFLSDPSYGASIIDVGPDHKGIERVHTVIPGQVAVCWTAADLALDTLYAIDAGLDSIHTLDARTGALKGSIAITTPGDATNVGLFDSAVRNGIMYSLTHANGVSVVDLKQKKQLQYLGLSTLGSRQGYMGMALWP